jgi:hypothetical protein
MEFHGHCKNLPMSTDKLPNKQKIEKMMEHFSEQEVNTFRRIAKCSRDKMLSKVGH